MSSENSMILIKQVEKDLYRGKLVHEPRAINRLNAIIIKIPMSVFTEQEQIILNTVWKQKKCRTYKMILRRKTKLEASLIPISNYKTKLQSSNSMVIAQKQTHKSMNREPRNEHTLLGTINLWQRGKNIQQGKDTLQKMVLGKLDRYMENNKTGLFSQAKMNSKYIKHLMEVLQP